MPYNAHWRIVRVAAGLVVGATCFRRAEHEGGTEVGCAPADSAATVLAHDRRVYNLCVPTGVMVHLRVRGSSVSDIDCVVKTGDGREVTRDDDNTDYCMLDWPADGAESYKLEILNRGSVTTTVQIVNNASSVRSEP
jgi:hypothetical protein